ncbi:CpsD/CapB family tyrosine-protein kinase [Clostridium nigeriense]|uniref:CpsD/CapB family tyrosine-protein kinase n=1 Tax=Clostridium nigeriense TaxID=1805470 RepID=UPI003D32A553
MFIVEKEPKSMAAESYRILRTNIEYSSFDKEYKVIVVTSSEPEEGKSTTAGNLALCMAQVDKKVMLIDCDLRKPSMHKRFKVSNLIGLSDVMIGKADLTMATHMYNKNLFLLTSGKISPNPSEMLSSKVMSYLLESLKETFDYIILDTPPLKVVTDAQILSTKADGTILVVRAEKTKRESVKNAVDLLKNVNANIIGIVLNGIDASRNKYDYYYEYKK